MSRVSSLGQDLTVQLEKLASCDKVFKEASGGYFDRPQNVHFQGR
jgi:hypothetical protein